MAGLINEEDVRALRERADLVEVVSDHTTLKRAGSRWKGLCPFHSEKTPSFTVDQAKGYYCFGCGASGDVYSFLQTVEALSFPEAVERLARRMGYTLRYQELSPGQRKALGRRTRLSECMAAAADFYRRQLRSPAGVPAREYLKGRGLGGEEADHFGLGWAPDAWDQLTKHLVAEGFDPGEITDAGLARQGRHGPMDFFRGRVLFPIMESSGRDVVAFGGRIVPGLELDTAGRDGSPPKYINSVETELYKKSRTLYGLNWARAEIARRGTALIVEGYMDVIGLHLAGVQHAVATCGTALTTEHFSQLQKFAGRVVLALDADDAGYAAAERARQMAVEADIDHVGVLPLPEGEDPADLATGGVAAVEAALEATKTSVEFQLEHLLRTADVATPEGQAAAYRTTFGLLAKLDDRTLRYRYIRDVVAPAVQLSADRIEQELDAHLLGGGAGPGGAPQAGSARPSDGGSRAGGSGPSRSGDDGRGRSPGSRHADGSRRLSAQLRLERQVLQAALQTPDLLPDDFAELTEDDFTSDVSARLLRAWRTAGSPELRGILAELPDDATRDRVRALALSDAEFAHERHAVAELVTDLRRLAVQRRITEVKGRLGARNEHMPPAERNSLMAEHARLEAQRRALTERSRA